MFVHSNDPAESVLDKTPEGRNSLHLGTLIPPGDLSKGKAVIAGPLPEAFPFRFSSRDPHWPGFRSVAKGRAFIFLSKAKVPWNRSDQSVCFLQE